MKQWHDALKERLKSDQQAAERIFPEWKQKAPSEVELSRSTHVALANRIGKLQKEGDSTNWWAKRPTLCQLLADAVGVEVHDIFDRDLPGTTVPFREFPGLRPLERTEAPFRSTEGGSVFDLALRELRTGSLPRAWLVVPPGGGKSLALALVDQRHSDEADTVRVNRLHQALPSAQATSKRHLLIQVDEQDEQDLEMLELLDQAQRGAVVLAPFDCPAGRTRGTTTWRQVRAMLREAWVERMIEWIDHRLDASHRDTKLVREDVHAWLEAHPWVAAALRSPGDVLALCADFDVFGADSEPWDRATRWLEQIGKRALPPDTPVTWRTQLFAGTVRSMIVADVDDQRHALNDRSFDRLPNDN